MILRDMGHHMDAVSYFAGLVYQDESVIVDLRPLRSNAVQIPPFGKECAAYGIGRDDNFSLLIILQEIAQAACMVTMAVGNENIVHINEVYAQQLCISDKHVACSSIKQNLVSLRLQKD